MNPDLPAFPTGYGRHFLEQSGAVVVLRVSREGVILAANRHASEWFGEPLLGKAWHTLRANPAGTTSLTSWLADTTRPRLWNVRTTTGLPQTLEVTVEAAGEDWILFGEINAAEQARLGRVVLELNHELNHLTRELALRNAELAQLNALKNQFLGMAAHDLRRPIGLILSYAGILSEEASATWSIEHREFLRILIGAAERMRRVVDDFLDVSLIEAGRFSLDEQPADLGELAQAAMSLVQISATKRRVRIVMTLDPAIRRMVVDGAKIGQVLVNLLGNAVDHSPEGGTVTLSSQQLPAEISIQVADAGPGITPAQQEHLFAAFAKGPTHKSTGERSIGLGLTIARKIVEAHGGRMLVGSDPGQGAVVGFTLPLSRLAWSAHDSA